MNNTARTFVWPLCLFVMMAAPLTKATPIPTGTASNDLLVNFDFSSVTPPPGPPYQAMTITVEGSASAGATIVVDAYGSLNGNDPLGFFFSVGPFGAPAPFSFTLACPEPGLTACPGLLDGVFSLGFHTPSSTADLADTSDTAHFAAAVTITPITMATPVPTGTASNDLIVNFDFSSATPPPPYQTMSITAEASTSGGSTTLVEDAYGSLNGNDPLGLLDFVISPGGPATLFLPTTCPGPSACPDLLDGIFSLGYHTTSGAADFMDLTSASATAHFAATVTLPGTLVTRTVPEPTTLALLGLGLAGLWFSRVTKRNLPIAAGPGD